MRTWGMLLLIVLSACETVPRKAEPPSVVPHRLVTAPQPLPAPAQFIAQEHRAAAAAGERILVYIGAPWCEPCVRFHQALLAHELDGKLPTTRFLEFDADTHGEALAAIGYGGRKVPRFVVPGVDGRATGLATEGAIKGEEAPHYIVGKLLPLLRP